jgi:hypothetical protein
MDPLDAIKTLVDSGSQSPTVSLLILAIALSSAVFGGVVKIIQLAMESRTNTRAELMQMNNLLRDELKTLGARIEALERENETKNLTIHALEFRMARVRRVVFDRFAFDIDEVNSAHPSI